MITDASEYSRTPLSVFIFSLWIWISVTAFFEPSGFEQTHLTKRKFQSTRKFSNYFMPDKLFMAWSTNTAIVTNRPSKAGDYSPKNSIIQSVLSFLEDLHFVLNLHLLRNKLAFLLSLVTHFLYWHSSGFTDHSNFSYLLPSVLFILQLSSLCISEHPGGASLVLQDWMVTVWSCLLLLLLPYSLSHVPHTFSHSSLRCLWTCWTLLEFFRVQGVCSAIFRMHLRDHLCSIQYPDWELLWATPKVLSLRWDFAG